MGERIVWEGDADPLSPETLAGVEDLWLRGGSYSAVSDQGKCYVKWGEKPVLSIAAEEREGKWVLVMKQNPNMGPFPDPVMDRYAELVKPIVAHLTRTPEDTPRFG